MINQPWPAQRHKRPRQRRLRRLTEHVSAVVLMAALVGNVCLHAEVDECQVFDTVLGRADAADEAEAAAVVDLGAELVQPGPEQREGKRIPGDMLAVQAKLCMK